MRGFWCSSRVSSTGAAAVEGDAVAPTLAGAAVGPAVGAAGVGVAADEHAETMRARLNRTLRTLDLRTTLLLEMVG